MFGIAEFPGPAGKKEVAIVHKNWVTGTKCFWPPFWRNSGQLSAALKAGERPDPSTWFVYEVHIVGGRFFNSYKEARSKLPRALDGSELSSEESSNKFRKRQNLDVRSESSGSDDLDTFVKPKRPKPARQKTARVPSLPPPPQPPIIPVGNPRSPQPSLVAVADLLNDAGGQTQDENILWPAHDVVTGLPAAVDNVISLSPEHIQSRMDVSDVNNWIEPGSTIFSQIRGHSGSYLAPGATQASSNFQDREDIRALQVNQEIIITKLDLVLDYLRTNALSRTLSTDARSNEETTMSISMPVRTLQDFERLDSEIKNNADVKRGVVDVLSRRGGNGPTQIVHRIVAYILTDNLMLEFTFKGHTGRKSFNDSNMMSCVYDAVRQQPMGAPMKDNQIEKAVEYWIKKASTRLAVKGTPRKRISQSLQLSSDRNVESSENSGQVDLSADGN